MEDLQIGAAMIKEALDRELVKEGRDQRRRAEEKAAHEAAVAKVAFAVSIHAIRSLRNVTGQTSFL